MKIKNLTIITAIAVCLISFSTVGVFAQESATDSSEAIRDQIQQNTRSLTKPTAYIGAVTDISESGMQLSKYLLKNGQTGSKEILQIAVKPDTTYSSMGKANKVTKFSEVAIGDFVVAMGYKNGNTVLDGKRLLVVEPLKPLNIISYKAVVKSVAKDGLTVTMVTLQKEANLKVSSTTRITTTRDGQSVRIKLIDLEETDNLIIIGSQGEKDFDVRRIHLLPSVD